MALSPEILKGWAELGGQTLLSPPALGRAPPRAARVPPPPADPLWSPQTVAGAAAHSLRGARRSRPGLARGRGSSPRSDVAGGRKQGVAAAAGSLLHVCKRRRGPRPEPRCPSAVHPRQLRAARLTRPGSSPRRRRWRSGPGAGGPRRRCSCCCSG